MKCNFKFALLEDDTAYCQLKLYRLNLDHKKCDGDDCIFMKILKQHKDNDTKERVEKYKFDIIEKLECSNCGKVICYIVPSQDGGAVLTNIQEILCPSCYFAGGD